MFDSHTPDKLPDREKDSYLALGLKLVPFLETSLLMIALYQLGYASGGIAGWLKLCVFGIAAYTISYLTYRMAIEKGATLNTVGYRTAGVIGGVSVFLVGMAFFVATSAGLTITQVEEIRLGAHLEAQNTYVDARSADAAQAARLAPVILAIASDLEAKAACEVESSCVSARGSGGYGPTSRMLETLAARARGIADQLENGLSNRVDLQKTLAALLDHMDETLSDESVNIWTRRAELRKHDGYVGRLLGNLDEAVPSALVTAYAGELRSGVSIPNRPQVSDAIGRILAGYAGSIDAAVADVDGEIMEKPSFPRRTGAMDTFAYAATFAPLFLLAFMIDVAFGMALWAYTIMGLDWGRFSKNPDPKRGARKKTVFDNVTELQPFDIREARRNMDVEDDDDLPPEPRPTHRANSRKRRH